MRLVHQSKITIPPVRGVPRPRLVAQVETGVRGKLTVVTAPAGWGKSSLLAEWARQTEIPVAWFSLEHADNDPHRFFRGVAAAIAHIYPLPMDDVLTLLRSSSPATDDLIDLAILARMEEIPGEIAIVLDDVHVLTGAEQLRSLGRVIEHMPPHVHMLMATRGDVRFPLARLRAAGEVIIIRSADLAFDAAEASQLLASPTKADPSEAMLQALIERTEGWAAGLRLASFGLRKHGADTSDLERIRGNAGDFADYFREEVLTRLDRPTREFLIETSMLDRFSAELCEAVADHPSVRGVLDEAIAADLFVVPLDDDGVWFRYHALFSELLRHEFLRLPIERQHRFHQRASRWFAQHEQVVAAVDHALMGCDADRAASLIDAHGDTLMFACGESMQIVTWIEALDDPVVRLRPGLVRVYAWALTTIGRIDQAERVLQRAWADVQASNDDDDIERNALLTAVQARVAAYRGDNAATITFGQRALALLDPLSHARVFSDVVLSMGFAWRSLGKLEEAIAAFAEAATLGRVHGNGQAARWGSRYGALTRLTQGRLREAEAIIAEDQDRLVTEGVHKGNLWAALQLTAAELMLERNQLEQARERLNMAIPIIQRVGDAKLLMNVYVTMGAVLQAQGDLVHAREKLRRAEDIFTFTVPAFRLARLDLAEGNRETALRWAYRSGFSLSDLADPNRGEDEQAAYARIVALAEPSLEAIGLLDRLIADAEQGGRFRRVLEHHVVKALGLSRLGDQSAAIQSLAQAIGLARDEGFTQVFLGEGIEMQHLLRELARQRDRLADADRRFVMSLLGGLAQSSSQPSVTDTTTAVLPESLTERQFEILRLLADGRSNREIAADLYIAEGTVKAHVHQITGKLMARNRTEAVANARNLQLIT